MNEKEETDSEKLERIKLALYAYFSMLDNRQHGGVAAFKFVGEVEQIFSLHWYQGITKDLQK